MSSPFRDNLLSGKTAFITGGGSGICQRIAERYAAMGANVMINGRKQEKLDTAAAIIAGRGGSVATHAADVRDYAAIESGLVRCCEMFGLIDILVCGAAGNFPAPVTGMSANGFKAVIDIDLLGTFNTCRAAFDHLRKPGASIIAISANHASQAYGWQSHVCAAKAGVERLTQCLALEWGPMGIRANLINPGPIDETEGMSRLAPTPEARRAVVENVPLRRMGRKDDIADMALFLVSDAASYVNGAVMVCDGGQILTGARTLSSAGLGQ
ncbi:MAG: SDR family oxidoreductase [Acidobacteria bacterium]|nr:SDR family oxidoreductase [Acidobacteriota bacterium]